MKSFTLTAALVTAALAADNPYASYPSVAHTATYNGIADRAIPSLPECAKDCVKEDTGNTPCPYWDPGCLCYMPQWGGPVGECFAKSCTGEDVMSASSAVNGVCESVGASAWKIPSSVSTELSSAAEAKATATSASVKPSAVPAQTSQAATSAGSAPSTGAGESSAAAAATSAAGVGSSSAGSAAVTSAPGTSTAAGGQSEGKGSASAGAESSAAQSSVAAVSSSASNGTSAGAASSTGIDQTNGGAILSFSALTFVVGAAALLI